MTEEESPSIFGGLADAASGALNAVEDYGSSQFHAAEGVAEVFGSGEASVVAGAAYAFGAYDTAKEHDQISNELAQDAHTSFEASNSELQQAGDDITGG
jgi:hypothetical protein